MPQNKRMKDQITKLRFTIRKRLKQVQRLEEERAVLQEKLPRLQSEVDRATAVVQALQCFAQLRNSEQLQRAVLPGESCEDDPLVPNDIVQMGLTAAATEQEAQYATQIESVLLHALASCSGAASPAPNCLDSDSRCLGNSSSNSTIGSTGACGSNSTMMHTLMRKEQEVQQLMQASAAHAAGFCLLLHTNNHGAVLAADASVHQR